MSKLEDKLGASLKPKGAQPGKAPADKRAAASKAPTKARTTTRDAVTDLNAPGQVLHPFRIWPD
jgi:hypothetical protein